MTRRITDLAQALSKEPAGTGIGLAKATIQSWDSTTFENRLEYYGTVLEDVPVMSGTDALTYQAGDEVTLLTYHPVDGHRHRGLGSYWILGRVVRPGVENAARVIQFLQSELAKTIVDEIVEELLVSEAGQELAAFVFAQRVHTDKVLDEIALTNQTTFIDGPAPVGPTVTADISDSGKAVVLASCLIDTTLPTGLGTGGGFVGVSVSGSTTVAASLEDSLLLGSVNHNSSGTNRSEYRRGGGVFVLDSLNPGSHTFRMQYRTFAGSAIECRFSNRTLVVIAL